MQVKIFLQYILFIPPFMTLYSSVALRETLGNAIKKQAARHFVCDSPFKFYSYFIYILAFPLA